MKRPLNSIASDFFEYLGDHLPQQCASDEFYFLPRSENAVQHLDILDDLSPEKIQDHIRFVKDLLYEITPGQQTELEQEIDRFFLRQSLESFIREFEDAETWRTDPTLYVKIPLFATDHIISQNDAAPDQLKAKLLNLFDQIPPFLDLAAKNLRLPSEISLQVALDMTRDTLHFYDSDMRAFIEEKAENKKALLSKNKKVLEAWEHYRKKLLDLRPKKSFAIGEDGLKKILAISLGYPKSLEEIQKVAQCAYQEVQDKLHTLARSINSLKAWNLIMYENLPSVSSQAEVLKLYEKEVHDLRSFFRSKDIITFPSEEKVFVLQTPPYLQSLRATASYKAPLTGSIKSRGVFYVTPGKVELEVISSHCPYLSAHETYPGHHVLDHIRIHHTNPIRRQIESPLFYEGWACYAEKLVDELGYVKDPRQQLIGLKRQLWRCLRATLDIGLQTGTITLSHGANQLESIGIYPGTAKRQIRRFCITPGYQLCYFVGMNEIIRLRDKFSTRLGQKTFYDILLGGGELPFHLVERRLEKAKDEAEGRPIDHVKMDFVEG